MLTKTQVKVILTLLDDKGHAEWELAEYLEMEDSNLNPILKDLEKMEIIYKGNFRLSKRQHENEGIYREIPDLLSKSLRGFKALIREIAETSRPYDTGYLLEIIDNSKYLKIMKEQFKEEINTIINNELSDEDSPYSDPFFVKRIKPELEEELFCSLEPDSVAEIQSWREKCSRCGQEHSCSDLKLPDSIKTI
jgi:DNA-binding MarR family transcriptional regulator